MSLTLTRLRYLLRKGLGVALDTSDLNDEDADELLNMSLWPLEDSFPFKAKEECYTVSLVEGQFQYDLSGITNLDALRSISIEDSDGKSHKLMRTTRDWWDENYNSATDARGFPERYFRHKDTLMVYPVPSDVEAGLTLQIITSDSVASLVNAGDTPDGLPRNWHEIVLHGAIWRGHYFNEDYNLAQQAANFQIGLIRQAVTTEAKEEEDSRYAGLEVLHDWPD